MKSNSKIFTAIATALLLAPSVEAGPKKAPPQEPWDQIDRRKSAEIRAELMAPTMTRAEAEKVAAVLAVRKERADREVAAYEQFRMDQQLALAEASASRTNVVINNYMETPGKDRPAAMVSSLSGGLSQVAYSQTATSEPSKRAFLTGEPAQRIPKNYPPRFYRRAAQEESVDKQAAAFSAQALLEALAPLFGQPVPGMPGYATGPATRNKGFIDVRGLAPGTEVRDPYTGERMRVPQNDHPPTN